MSTTHQSVEDLRKAVELLQDAYERAYEDTRKWLPEPRSLLAQTSDGRYILLDALTALVDARTVLARADELSSLAAVIKNVDTR